MVIFVWLTNKSSDQNFFRERLRPATLILYLNTTICGYSNSTKDSVALMLSCHTCNCGEEWKSNPRHSMTFRWDCENLVFPIIFIWLYGFRDFSSSKIQEKQFFRRFPENIRNIEASVTTKAIAGSCRIVALFVIVDSYWFPKQVFSISVVTSFGIFSTILKVIDRIYVRHSIVNCNISGFWIYVYFF